MGGAEAENVNWAEDEYWRRRRLSPAQLQIFDVHLASWGRDEQVGPILEIGETLSSTLLPALGDRDRLARELHIESHGENRHEQTAWRQMLNEYGWMNCLRSKGVQTSLDAPKDHRKLRWIHISSKFTEYLHGCLLGLSDWARDAAACAESLRQLEHTVYHNERFSKHGRYFAPFYDRLSDASPVRGGPMLISVPYLDWSADDPPPLRFQIDPREGYQSSRSTAHLMRSILQHFYRLEDTSDREHQQVFAKHKPWLTDRELDLKVRRFYGQYPSVLNVDELWILVIDERHVVTFATNQSWKSRWPPLQVSWRIAEVSFRGIRNTLLLAEDDPEYTAYTHVIACLSGALGILHRAFWTDITLCLTDRFAGHLGHLQYRLHRSPSTKLVMDLLQVQEELNIIISVMQNQIELLQNLDATWQEINEAVTRDLDTAQTNQQKRSSRTAARVVTHASRSTFRQHSSSTLKDPMAQLLENLKREFTDLVELRDNSNNLLNRTIQLVNIRLEDHGKAILVFTIVTIIFLPLSFVSSFFGMNTIDIRNMTASQSVFWIVSCSLTVCVVGFAIFLAFYGGAILEAFFTWKANRMKPRRKRIKMKKASPSQQVPFKNFEVLDSNVVRKFF
ncbi:uncharacterized protein PV09_04914 [Verruconis gallopava]|uniref:Uncharacterized protein n=1 Tax=Verruconis gallopava TaxID=253628 RepID=A0A0D2AY78_9PEZI|nr:uncharacterized protein PV09_04914 [Verruconis gallopava]KIW04099.1 hypothetical protein PV09_04914 [Verruconis gallopava]